MESDAERETEDIRPDEYACDAMVLRAILGERTRILALFSLLIAGGSADERLLKETVRDYERGAHGIEKNIFAAATDNFIAEKNGKKIQLLEQEFDGLLLRSQSASWNVLSAIREKFPLLFANVVPARAITKHPSGKLSVNNGKQVIESPEEKKAPQSPIPNVQPSITIVPPPSVPPTPKPASRPPKPRPIPPVETGNVKSYGNVFEAILDGDDSYEPDAQDPNFLPTDAPPGSIERLEVMARRVARGQPREHPLDRTDFSGLTPGIINPSDIDSADQEPEVPRRMSRIPKSFQHVEDRGDK